MTLNPQAIANMQKGLSKIYRKEILASAELHRVLDLPKVDWEKAEDLESFTALATRSLKLPQGTQTLWPQQAAALRYAHDCGGLFGPIPVGNGKTLISFLAPVVLDSKRPLLIVPARLRDKTYREFAVLEQHWKSHPGLQVVSYEKISNASGTAFLQKHRPDLIIFDEVHKLKNKGAAVTRKISAWMRTFPETRILAMSGTVTKRSLLDFNHILEWALPQGCPLPKPRLEVEAWAAAVDEIKPHEQREPTEPGALAMLCDPVERTQGREGVRKALRRRIQQTPGVLACRGQKVDASLNISLVLEAGYGRVVRGLAKKLQEGVLPNGDVFLVEGKEGSAAALNARWRTMRTLTSGFWYDWDPKPPADWMELRAGWKRVVRRLLEEHLPGLESEALVTRAAQQRKLGASAYELYERWAGVRNEHKWDVVPVWVDDAIVQRVAKWVKVHNGLIWVSEVALGERLEKELGLPYFHEMGKDRLGRPVMSTRPSDGSVVVSVASISDGQNLQAWNENLVISPPPTGSVWEQMIGRTHRPGQLADEVWFEVVIGCRVEWECWKQAVRDATFQTELEAPKKLTYATIDRTFSMPVEDGELW
jgi:hypothetical protein